jgi:hypothetical protein
LQFPHSNRGDLGIRSNKPPKFPEALELFQTGIGDGGGGEIQELQGGHPAEVDQTGVGELGTDEVEILQSLYAGNPLCTAIGNGDALTPKSLQTFQAA